MGGFSSYLLTFAAGVVFTIAVGIAAGILIFRSLPERVPSIPVKGRGRGKRRKGAHSVGSPAGAQARVPNGGDRNGMLKADTADQRQNGDSPYLAPKSMQGAYDPQLTKVGWMRIATRPLTTDELYMDGFGNPGEWFLDGLAVRPTASESLPGESLQSLPNAVKRKGGNLVANITTMSNTAVSIVEASLQTTSYLLSRFMGESPPLPAIAVASKTVENPYNSRPPWRNVFAVLKHKTLFVYSSDERLECLDIILLTEFKVELFPEHLKDSDIYLRETPIRLRLKDAPAGLGDEPTGLYLYTASGSDKEDWLFMLRRAAHLPPHADTGALSVHFQESEPMRHFTDAMVKLQNTVESLEGAEVHATAWINALIGRAFVGLHANPRIKDWVINKLSRRYTRARGTSILGDIVIQDLFVGDSIPILSNPKLLGFSSEGDVNVEVDIDYTGGVRVEAATVATISVSAFEPYVKPLEIPLVVAIKVKRFSARVLIKIKPFWETSRVWVGFYQEPGLKLELDVEPIISNKLIRLQVVNQIIERRIKEALNELVVLPNMDDFSFWPADGKGGIFWDSDDEEEDENEDDYEDAEEYGGEDENNALRDDRRVLRDDGKASKRTSTSTFGLEAVHEGSERGDEEETLDNGSLYQKLQEKYMEEAMRARQTEALWFAETAGLSDEEEEEQEDIGDMETDVDPRQASIDERSDIVSSSSSIPNESVIDGDLEEDANASVQSTDTDIASIRLSNQQARLSIVTSPQPSDSISNHENLDNNSDHPSSQDSVNTPISTPNTEQSTLRTSNAGPKTPTMSVFEYLGETAEYAGRKSREYGLDEMARNLSETATIYGSTLKSRTAFISDRTLAYFGYTRIKNGQLELASSNSGPTESGSLNSIAPSPSPVTDLDDDLPPRAKRSRPPSVVIEDPLEDLPTPRPLPTSAPRTISRPQTPEEPANAKPKKPRPPSFLEMLGVNITTAPPTSTPESKTSRKLKRRSLNIVSNPPPPPIPQDPLAAKTTRPKSILRKPSNSDMQPKSNLLRRSMDDLRSFKSTWSQPRQSLEFRHNTPMLSPDEGVYRSRASEFFENLSDEEEGDEGGSSRMIVQDPEQEMDASDEASWPSPDHVPPRRHFRGYSDGLGGQGHYASLEEFGAPMSGENRVGKRWSSMSLGRAAGTSLRRSLRPDEEYPEGGPAAEDSSSSLHYVLHDR
ncbi:hypothetical protein HDU97_001079 [Phlyctochytrium planicorne]|nr:hypothetical protein HDU97_001079 [Phlyctochytrium planicorne]